MKAEDVEDRLSARATALKAKDTHEADRIFLELLDDGVAIRDIVEGTQWWRI